MNGLRKWTDEEITKAIKEVYQKHGRIGSGLFKKELPGAYNAISRNWLNKGKFKSMKEALEEVMREEELRQWFLDLTLDIRRAADWFLNTILSRNPESIQTLNRLVGLAPEKVKEVSKEIQRKIPGEIPRPAHPSANRIFEEFLKTEEGEKLRSLIEQDPDLI